MKKLFLLLLAVIPGVTVAQKLYVWCPKDFDVKVRTGFLEKDTIDVNIFDGRVLADKSRIKCETMEVEDHLIGCVKDAYPNAIVIHLPSSEYFKDPCPGHITLKVGIAAFHAAFGADVTIGIGNIGGVFSYGVVPKGMWNAITAYSASIYDFRKGEKPKVVSDISKLDSHSNTGGYISAKNSLNRTYQQATQQLLLFIDQSLMK